MTGMAFIMYLKQERCEYLKLEIEKEKNQKSDSQEKMDYFSGLT